MTSAPDQKIEELLSLLERMPPDAVSRLYPMLEAGLSKGLSNETALRVMAALRNHARQPQPQPQPQAHPKPQSRTTPSVSLLQLVIEEIEIFLVATRHSGLRRGGILRAAVPPWWDFVRKSMPTEIGKLEADLLALDETHHRAIVTAAIGHACRVTQHALDRTSPLAKAVPRGLAEELEFLAQLLPIASVLRTEIRKIIAEVSPDAQAPPDQIPELTPRLTKHARIAYEQLEQVSGVSAVWFVHGLLVHLVKPWEILRLVTAVAGQNRNDLLEETELGEVLDRLFGDLEAKAATVGDAVQATENALTAETCRAVIAKLLAYVEAAEGFLSEHALDRASVWGTRLISTRKILGELFQSRFLDRIEAVVLPPAGPSASPNAAPDADLALTAAELLSLVVQKGTRHGFGSSAGGKLKKLSQTVEYRIDRLIDRDSRGTLRSQIEPELDGLAALANVLLDEVGRNGVRKRIDAVRNRWNNQG
jgi:hypothetical protein